MVTAEKKQDLYVGCLGFRLVTGNSVAISFRSHKRLKAWSAKQVRCLCAFLGWRYLSGNSPEQALLGTSSLYIEDQGLKMHRCFQAKAAGRFSRRTEESACDRFLIPTVIVPLPSPSLKRQLCP